MIRFVSQAPIDQSVENEVPFGLQSDAKPLVGDLVIAVYQDLFYRAVVLSLVDDDHAKVNFIDWFVCLSISDSSSMRAVRMFVGPTVGNEE